MKILFLPNFRVTKLPVDDEGIRDANRYVSADAYWFFRYWPECDVVVLDNVAPAGIRFVESKLKLYWHQSLKAAVKSNEFDLLVSHSYNSGMVLALLRSLAGARIPPLLVIDVGCLNGGRYIPWEIWVLRYSLRSVGGLAYHARIQEAFYARNFPEIPRRYVPFGVDTEFFRPLRRPSTQDFALSIGYAKRDYATLIRAWGGIDFPLRIVGRRSLPGRPGPSVESMPPVRIDILRELIHDARLVLLPIADDPYSTGQTTLLQCMAMGKPIIVTDVPGIRDYVDNGSTAVVVPPKDSRALHEAADELLKSEAAASRIGAMALDVVRERYTESLMARSLFGFAKSVKESRPSVRGR